MIGLHQALEPALALMVSDRRTLEDATTRFRQGALQHNVVYSEHRVNVLFTFFDTDVHSDHEILHIAAKEMGLSFDDPPIWKSTQGTVDLSKQQLLASVSRMDDLLWGYLSQTLINVDVFMAPHSAGDDVTLFVKGELTRHARETYGAHSFPLAVESDMRMKDVDMLIRTPSRQNWYKAMLKTGIFDFIFRTEEDRLKFEELPQSQRSFTVLEDA
jgi:hypothetical protein